MDDVTQAQQLIGNEVYDSHGDKIGRVDNVYVDDATHQPEWITVRTGLLKTKENFVPLNNSSTSSGRIDVSVAKTKVKSAPRIDTEYGHLSDREGRELYMYYGLRPGETTGPRSGGPESSTETTMPDGPQHSGHDQPNQGASGGHATGKQPGSGSYEDPHGKDPYGNNPIDRFKSSGSSTNPQRPGEHHPYS